MPFGSLSRSPFSEGNWHIGISRATNVIKHPFFVVGIDNSTKAFSAGIAGHFAILPVKNFYPVVILLFYPIDFYINLDFLLSVSLWNLYSHLTQG
jgi:hypothetical protein